MKFIKIYFFAAFISVTSAYGQVQMPEVINASGGTSKTKGYTLQWSIGELTLVNEMDDLDSSYILTNGFIQPPDTLVSSPMPPSALFSNNVQINSMNIRLFPNPTQDIVQIQLLKNIGGKVNIQLFNELGSIVYQHKILVHGSGLIEKINMKGLANGTYILYIKSISPMDGPNDFTIGTFKIIKL